MTRQDPGVTEVSRDPAGGPAPPPDAIAAPADRYRVVEALGEGGMGRVVRVRDDLLGRAVARKVMKGDPSGPRALRFWREAGLTAALEHPAIVPVYDAGQLPDGTPWYDMRLVDGQTLAAAITAAPDLGARLALVPALITACQAVAWAHDHGILHRDLKPANVLLGRYGETWVIDWGLAARVDDGAPDALPDDDLAPGLTRAGDRLGTPGWQSPEAAAGATLDRRADVWGLGAILHALLVGGSPPAPSTLASDGDRPPDPLPGDAPAPLAAIAAVCLRRDPDARYPDAAAVAAELVAWRDGRFVQAHRYPLREAVRLLARRHRVGLAATAAVLVALGLAAAASWSVTRAERDRALAAEAVLLEQQALRAADVEAWLEARPLAMRALEIAPGPTAQGVLATAITGPRLDRTARFDLPAACRRVVVAPDGARAACEEAERLSTWSLTSPVTRLGEVPGAPTGTVWADADHLRTVIGWRPLLVSATGEVTPGGPPGDRAPIRLAAGWSTLVESTAGVWLDGGPSRTTEPCGASGRVALAAATGRHLLAACVDDPRWRHGPPDGPVQAAASALDPRDVADLAWSPDGERLLAGLKDGRLRWLDPSGAPVGEMASSLPSLRRVGWAADASFVWAASDSGAVQLLDPTGAPSPGRLPDADTDVAGTAGGVWSWRPTPDGTRLDRHVVRHGRGGAFVASVGLAGACASPDGARLAGARSDGALSLWGPAHTLQPGPAGVLKRCAFGPDGRHVIAGGVGAAALFIDDLQDGTRRAVPTRDLIKRVAATAERVALVFTYQRGWHAVRLDDGAELAGRDRTMVVQEVAAGPGGSPVLAAWADGRVTRWDRAALDFSPLFEATVGALAVHPDLGVVTVEGDRVVVRGLDGGPPTRSWPTEREVLALATDGAHVAAGTLDGRVLVWDRAGHLRVTLPAGDERVPEVGFAGGLLFAASWDGQLRAWPVDALRAPPQGPGPVPLEEALVARPR